MHICIFLISQKHSFKVTQQKRWKENILNKNNIISPTLVRHSPISPIFIINRVKRKIVLKLSQPTFHNSRVSSLFSPYSLTPLHYMKRKQEHAQTLLLLIYIIWNKPTSWITYTRISMKFHFMLIICNTYFFLWTFFFCTFYVEKQEITVWLSCTIFPENLLFWIWFSFRGLPLVVFAVYRT